MWPVNWILFLLLSDAVFAQSGPVARSTACYEELVSGIRGGPPGRTRLEVDRAPSCVQQMARSVATLVPKSHLQRNDVNFRLRITGPRYGEKFGLCPGDDFADQISAGACNGVLIDRHHVMVPADCVKGDSLASLCSGNEVIFDYHAGLSEVQQAVLYHCVSAALVSNSGGKLALLRLDRPVRDREPAPRAKDPSSIGRPLIAVGGPGGLPLKVGAGGLNPSKKDPGRVMMHLDSHAANAGTVVFDGETRELVGLLGREAEAKGPRKCQKGRTLFLPGSKAPDIAKEIRVIAPAPRAPAAAPGVSGR